MAKRSLPGAKRPLPPAFARLAEQEKTFLTSEFIAPCKAGHKLAVKIANVNLEMAVKPDTYSGWGVFKVLHYGLAEFVRKPTMAQRTEYLKLYPLKRLLVSGRRGDTWYGRSAGMTKISLTGDAPIQFAEDIQLFDTVKTRFDGANFWFEARDTARSRHANHLRERFAKKNEVEMAGVTAEERLLFDEMVALREASEEAVRQARTAAEKRALEKRMRESAEGRLRLALEHAGAVLQGYREIQDAFTVEYLVDGKPHTSVLAKDDLTVRMSGICLSGQDATFDLTSLVSVLREGEQRRLINPVRLDPNNPYSGVQYRPRDDNDDDYDYDY